MWAEKSYVAPFATGETMAYSIVDKVIASSREDIAVGGNILWIQKVSGTLRTGTLTLCPCFPGSETIFPADSGSAAW